jgi:hypothetical protein
MSIAFTWGTDVTERALAYPCDRYVERAEAAYYRGVTVHAPAMVLFRWLCQLRVAPYSYDWLDNRGRRSPPTLTPGAEDLAVGQPIMRIFRLVESETGRHITLEIRKETGAFRLFGNLALTYLIVREGAGRCRLLVKISIQYPRGLMGTLMRAGLPWGDLVMMRRQLLNLKRLAEGR